MEDHIPLRPDGSLLKGRKTSKWSSWGVVFHENKSIYFLVPHMELLSREISCKFPLTNVQKM